MPHPPDGRPADERRSEAEEIVVSAGLDALSFTPPVDTVYDPLVCARCPHKAHLERYGAGRHEVLLVGMNPGP